MPDDLDPIIDPDPDPTPDPDPDPTPDPDPDPTPEPDPEPEDTAYLLFKAALGRKTVPAEIETLMRAKLNQARGGLRRAGLALSDNDPADCGLIAAYAEWLYTRRHVEDPKPRSLVDEISSRQIDRTTSAAAEEAAP